jgi:hypothetical protein
MATVAFPRSDMLTLDVLRNAFATRSKSKLPRVDVKLNSCGTHMEHIVSVHDLFRVTHAAGRRVQDPMSRIRTADAINWGLVEMLTRKQYELLRFINERLKESGVPPSFDEMKDALDLRSKCAAIPWWMPAFSTATWR